MPRNISPDIEHLRAQALTAIDEAAGRARARHLTEQPGQGAEYEAKSAEAASLLTGSPANTPVIDAEAAAMGVAPQKLARQISAARESATALIADVAALRRPAKVEIQNATSVAAIAKRRSEAVAALDTL